MKKLRGSLPAKILAIFLLSLLAVLCVLTALGTAWLYDAGAYTQGYEQTAGRVVSARAHNCCFEAGDAYRNGNYQNLFSDGNFRFTVSTMDGEELYSTYEGEDALWSETVTVEPHYTVERWDDVSSAPMAREEPPLVTPTPRPLESGLVITVYDQETGEEQSFSSEREFSQWRNEHKLLVRGYVLAELSADDEFRADLHGFRQLYAYRVALPAVAGASFLLGLLLFLFLLSSAGHRDGTDAITPNFVDRIPLDLFAALIAAGVSILFALTFEVNRVNDLMGYIAVALLLLGAALLFLLFCMSFATRVKLGTLWQNCLVTRLVRWCVRVLKSGGRLLVRGLRALPLLWRWAALLAGFLLLELLILALCDGKGTLLFFLHVFVLCPALLYLAWCLRRLRLGAHEIAGGNTAYTVDTNHLFGELREHAEDLNHIRDGIQAAVSERMKSEHFKSELITNVSHDIKTPLTSIVNYVDLLEKEELENEKAREYVEVLSRQSARLKKLIDDLIEASKASTGVLAVDPERVELGVLLDQCAGEYAERLEKAELELVVQKPQEPVAILADGRHMWRIFDNLLGNAVKYAQPGTRVYLNLEKEKGKALVTFRNISREALNLSGEELLERFVRGDSSRNTEGSGLGLAIARSLAQLQGGDMELTVDGDLFKVVLRFDAIE